MSGLLRAQPVKSLADVQQNFEEIAKFVHVGEGSPESKVRAPESATYHDRLGGAGCFWVKETGGFSPTGWVAK